jgi:hypothetical protein
MALGIAATAMPFAGSASAEAERWLRILRAHGESGLILSSLGVSEAPVDNAAGDAGASEGQSQSDAAARVHEAAVRHATRRGAGAVSTSDVLAAVIELYGDAFDRVLQAHGTGRDEVAELLDLQSEAGSPAVDDGSP